MIFEFGYLLIIGCKLVRSCLLNSFFSTYIVRDFLFCFVLLSRYISVLPPINVQYKIDALQFVNSMSPVSDSVSKFYKDFKESSPWTARSYTVKFELVDFVKVLYIFTGIFISVAIYMIYALLTTLPKRRRKKRQKAIVPKTSPVILDGHRQVMHYFHN